MAQAIDSIRVDNLRLKEEIRRLQKSLSNMGLHISKPTKPIAPSPMQRSFNRSMEKLGSPYNKKPQSHIRHQLAKQLGGFTGSLFSSPKAFNSRSRRANDFSINNGFTPQETHQSSAFGGSPRSQMSIADLEAGVTEMQENHEDFRQSIREEVDMLRSSIQRMEDRIGEDQFRESFHQERFETQPILRTSTTFPSSILKNSPRRKEASVGTEDIPKASSPKRLSRTNTLSRSVSPSRKSRSVSRSPSNLRSQQSDYKKSQKSFEIVYDNTNSLFDARSPQVLTRELEILRKENLFLRSRLHKRRISQKRLASRKRRISRKPKSGSVQKIRKNQATCIRCKTLSKGLSNVPRM